jgi:uncharacterized protein (TIGR03437 family)
MKCVFAIILTAAASFAANLDFSTGQAARLVIGQPYFDSESDSASNTILGAVGGVAYANNLLFVADSNVVGAAPVNNRVVIYQNISGQLPALTAQLPYNRVCPVCVGTANEVLGQPDFVTTLPIPCITPDNTSVTTPTTPVCPTNAPTTPQAIGMRQPAAVASDGTHLAVADTLNNRILIWNTIPTTIQQPPDVVVGQPNFTSASFPGDTPTATSLRGPQGVWLQNGVLYVADTQNDRVLIYNPIPTSNGASASVVVGAPNMTTYVQVNIAQQLTTATASNLLNPTSVTSDGTHLFITDLGYNRVLIFNSIPKSNGVSADVVVGQPDMTSSNPDDAFTCSIAGECPATASGQGVETPALCTVSNGVDFNNDPIYPSLCKYTLSYPRYALSDGTRLFIADSGNDRVLVYSTIPTANGAPADVVLGEANDTSDQPTDGADTLNTPTSVAWDGENLYVADCYNQRIMVFTVAEQDLTYTAVRNAASLNIYAIGTVTLGGTIKAGNSVTISINEASCTAAPSVGCYTYTIQSGDDFASIVNGLVALINAGKGDPNVLATGDDPADEIVVTARTAGSAGDNITLSTAISTNATITATASGANLSGGGDAAALAPGGLVSILGSNLSDGTATAPAGVESLPTTLGGVQVYFNGVLAPLMYVSPNQINSQVPWSFVSTTTANAWVRIQRKDGSISVTNPEAMTIVGANPGIFVQLSKLTDPRPGIVLHSSSFATGVVSVDGTIKAGDIGDICIGSNATLTVASTGTTGCTGQNYAYTVQASDTLASVVNAFVALMKGDPQVEAYAAPAFTRIVLQARAPGKAGDGIAFQTDVNTGANLLLTAIGPPVASGTGVTLCCASTGGALVTSSSPAVPGETVIVYATGLGLPVLTPAVRPYLLTGKVYLGTADNTPIESVSSLVDASTANVLGAFLLPGSVGVYQVNLQLSPSLATDPDAEMTIAQDIYVSNAVTFPVIATNTVSALSCTSTTLNSAGTTTCAVTLNLTVTGNGTTVSLSSNDSLLTLPPTVTVTPGSTSASFTITAGTIPSSQTAVITAALGTSSQTVSITLSP